MQHSNNSEALAVKLKQASYDGTESAHHITWAVSRERARDAKARLLMGSSHCASLVTLRTLETFCIPCGVLFVSSLSPLCVATFDYKFLSSSSFITRLLLHRTYRISNHILSPCLSSRFSGSRCSTTLPRSLHPTSSRSLLSVSSSFKKVHIS